jgi:predicted site-specific integrase-resolvase
MSMNTNKSARIYTRTATDGRNAEENLDCQILLCQEIAAKGDDGDAEVIRDMASYEGRHALLQAAEEGGIGRVYVARRDRISRDPVECTEVLQTPCRRMASK